MLVHGSMYTFEMAEVKKAGFKKEQIAIMTLALLCISRRMPSERSINDFDRASMRSQMADPPREGAMGCAAAYRDQSQFRPSPRFRGETVCAGGSFRLSPRTTCHSAPLAKSGREFAAWRSAWPIAFKGAKNGPP